MRVLWLLVIVLVSTTVGLCEIISFDRTIQPLPEIVIAPAQLAPVMRIYEFRPLRAFGPVARTTSAGVTAMSTQKAQPNLNLRLVNLTDPLSAAFTPMIPDASLGGANQFRPLGLGFTPLK